MANIKDLAAADWHKITSNKASGFGYDISITTPDGAKTSVIVGTTSKHHIGFDTEGALVNVKNVQISFSEQQLTEDSYPVRNVNNEVQLRGHKVVTKDSTGNDRNYIITENFPDETIGMIVCILGDYANNTSEENQPSYIFKCADAVVVNSDSTFTYNIPSNDTYILPDITHTDSNLSPVILPAQIPMVCTPNAALNISNSNDTYDVNTLVDLELPNINKTDSDGITTSVPSMEDVICTPCEVKSGIAHPSIPYSGNLVSFNNYDEAWQMLNGVLDRTNPTNPTHVAELDYTSLTPFFTLKQNNKYGNLDRITDDLGTQIYANNLIVDNLYNIMYWQIGLTLDTQTNHLITANASTNGGFTDWNLASKAILESIRNHGLANGNSLVQPIVQTSSIVYTSTRTPAGTLVQYITSAGTTLQQATTFLWSGLLWRKLTD